MGLTVSVVMPVFNERETIGEVLRRLDEVPLDLEVIVVDDCSTDGTRELLKELEASHGLTVLYHGKNMGKGAAVRKGLQVITGDVVVIQDADLEYLPSEYPILLRPILMGQADVVYGSRFLGTHRVFYFWHYMGNRFLTFLTNLLYNTMLTDMETCLKMFRAEVIRNLSLRSCGFDIEPEITAKVFKGGWRVYETPVSYFGRSYEEGKKIRWKDGLRAIWALVKYRFVD